MNRLKVLFLILLFLSQSTEAQSQFQSFINKVNAAATASAKQGIVDSFIAANTNKFPFVENTTANFVYRGNATNVNVAGDFNGWSSNTQMTNLSQTNLFYYTRVFEINARLDYKFIVNGSNWILDPLNSKTILGGFGPNSELAMPGYIQPWEINYNNSIQHGTVETKTIYSTNTSSAYQLKIYLPPEYSVSSQNYPVVYFQDGYEYVDLASAVNVIDNLIDSGKIQHVIGVFVKPNNRNEEFAGSKRNSYRLFFVNELVPFIDSIYRTIKSPSKRLVLGDSYGANISALISYNHADVFGNCGLHSGAFQPNGYEAYNLIVNGVKKDIRFCSVWGTYESLFSNMRNFRDSLHSKGYEFDWLELPEGHSWGLWRATIDRILEFTFPKSSTDIEHKKKVETEFGFELFQNYPNPFNPNTVISYQLSASSNVVLKIFDVLGKEVATLIDNEWKQEGIHNYQFSLINSPFSSGVYFYQLHFDGKIETKRMIILK